MRHCRCRFLQYEWRDFELVGKIHTFFVVTPVRSETLSCIYIIFGYNYVLFIFVFRIWLDSSPSWVKNFFFSMSSRSALVSTQPPIQWVPGTISPGVKWPWREADHSPPTSAEVKKMWIYTSTPPYAFMA
jgi:hypothetical protein